MSYYCIFYSRIQWFHRRNMCRVSSQCRCE